MDGLWAGAVAKRDAAVRAVEAVRAVAATEAAVTEAGMAAAAQKELQDDETPPHEENAPSDRPASHAHPAEAPTRATIFATN